MEHIWQRFMDGLMGRLDGPLHFRFIAQPLMAVIFAVIDGIKDAKADKPAYFWAMIFNQGHRQELLKSGWKSVGKIFILAAILDVVYQLKVFHEIRLIGILLTAVILALIPYLLIRGPVNRIARLVLTKKGRG